VVRVSGGSGAHERGGARGGQEQRARAQHMPTVRTFRSAGSWSAERGLLAVCCTKPNELAMPNA
jgi:hypothetical protein